MFVNVAGGLRLTEPAIDLGIACAVASSARGRALDSRTIVFGEVGLAGEIRGITQAALRVREATQMGFLRCVMPEANIDGSEATGPCELVGVRTVGEALDALL